MRGFLLRVDCCGSSLGWTYAGRNERGIPLGFVHGA